MSSSTPPSRSESLAGPGQESIRASRPLPAENIQSPPWHTFAVCIFLAAIVSVVFSQTLHFDFINFDDPAYVYNNPHLNHGLDWNEVVWVFTHENFHEWFPVTYVSRMVDSQIYGLNAGGHHLTNVLLHTATAIFLFLVLKKMTGAFWRPAFVAAIFAIHPLRVESVAWVVERKDVLSGLFFMLTLWYWIEYVRNRPAGRPSPPHTFVSDSPNRRWIIAYILALICFTLGLLSKSILVTLPFVLLLLDYWPLNRLPSSFASGFSAWRGLILDKVAFLVLSIAAGVATMITQKNVVLTAQHTPLFWRIGQVILAYTDYLKHLVYPVGLTLVYPYSNTTPPILTLILCGLLLAAISVVAVAARRNHPYLLVGWFWYLGIFLPVIDSMQATQNSHADRYSYLPHIGLYIMAAWGAAELLKSFRYRRALFAFCAAIILTVLMVDTYIQTGYWKNSVIIWTRTVTLTSHNYFAENLLGSALANEGKWNEAIPHFERSIKYNPNSDDTHVNLGITLANLERRDEAIKQFKIALQLNPNSADAAYNLGGVLADQGKSAEALPYFAQALQLNPNNVHAHYDFGLALATLGKWDDAVSQYGQAFGRKLELADAQYITAIAFAAHGKQDNAIVLYDRVLQTRPDSAETHYHLGIVLAAQGKSTEAGLHFQKALDLATAQNNPSLAESIRAQISTNSQASQPPGKP